MASNKTNVLIIGGGKKGKSLITLFRDNEKIEIKGIVDIDPNAPGMKLAKEKGIPTFTDYKRFLEDNKIDKIINAVGSKKVQEDLAKIKRTNIEIMGKHSTRLMLDIVNERIEARKELETTKKELELQSWGMKKTNEGIKTLYKELEKKTEELKRLDTLKSDFISTVSHELRTPLTIIREAVAQVLDGILGETTKEQREFLSVGLSDIDRLGRIINDLLDISKIERGKMEIKRNKINIMEIIGSVHASFLPKVKNKGIEIKIKCSQKEIIFYAERDQIIQVFNNLVGNALKFTEKGNITISATDKKNKIECSVSDTGRGVSKEDVPKLFSKFQQFGRSNGPGEKGTGLGLAISKGIIELYKGKIGAKSEMGKGTKFIFTLPKYTPKKLFNKEIERNIAEFEDQDILFSAAVIRMEEWDKLEKKIGKEKLSNILDKFENLGKKNLDYMQNFIIRDKNELLLVFPSKGKEDALQIIEKLKKSFSDFLSEKGIKENTGIAFDLAVYPKDAKKIKKFGQN